MLCTASAPITILPVLLALPPALPPCPPPPPPALPPRPTPLHLYIKSCLSSRPSHQRSAPSSKAWDNTTTHTCACHCRHITGASLPDVAQSCPCLLVLNLSHCASLEGWSSNASEVGGRRQMAGQAISPRAPRRLTARCADRTLPGAHSHRIRSFGLLVCLPSTIE